MIVLLAIGVVFGFVVFYSVDRDKHEPRQAPNDWFFRQRAYPFEEINYEARKIAWEMAQQFRAEHAERGEGGISKGSYMLIIREKNSMVYEKFIKL